MRIKGLAAGVIGLALGSALLTGCGGSAGGSGTITIYNGQHPQTTAALVDAFQIKTGITASVRNGSEDVLANQIGAEGEHSPADVFIAENSPALEFLQAKGRLARVDPATLAQVPAKYSSPQGRWVGISARVSVMVYNTTMLRPGRLPTSVLALADPQWQGKLAIAPGETDFQPIVTSVLAQVGPAATLRWLEGIKANAAGHVYPDSEAIVTNVNDGQAAIGVVNQYYWYRSRVQAGAAGTNSAIAFFAAHDPGYVLDVSGASVIRSSKRASDAQKFLAFVVSPQGQAIIAHSDSFEYPIRAGVATGRGQVPLGRLSPSPITVSQLGTGAAAVALLQRAQLL